MGGLTKIVVNMGVGEAARDSKALEGAIRDLTAITGQKPQTSKAKKSIAQFKRAKARLLAIRHPPWRPHVEFRPPLDCASRIRDFRGLSEAVRWTRHHLGLTGVHVPRDRSVPSTAFAVWTSRCRYSASTDEEGRALLRHSASRLSED